MALEADNGGDEPHELVVVRADGVGAIPTNDDGSVDEEAIPAEDLIGEVEPFPAGETCTGVFDLAPGDYVLFCAIVETEPDGTVEDHFANGMATTISVAGEG